MSRQCSISLCTSFRKPRARPSVPAAAPARTLAQLLRPARGLGAAPRRPRRGRGGCRDLARPVAPVDRGLDRGRALAARGRGRGQARLNVAAGAGGSENPGIGPRLARQTISTSSSPPRTTGSSKGSAPMRRLRPGSRPWSSCRRPAVFSAPATLFGIARMNGGFATRPFVGLVPPGGLGAATGAGTSPCSFRRRDWFFERVEEFVEADGAALLWCLPWDGERSLGLDQLDPSVHRGLPARPALLSAPRERSWPEV